MSVSPEFIAGLPKVELHVHHVGSALPRIVASLLEQYQQPDGTVLVPEALRPYLGTDRIG